MLAYSSQHHQLTCYSANVELFELFAKYEILTQKQAQTLTHAYRQLRNIYHRLTLQKQDKLTDNEYAQALSVEIQEIWKAVF